MRTPGWILMVGLVACGDSDARRDLEGRLEGKSRALQEAEAQLEAERQRRLAEDKAELERRSGLKLNLPAGVMEIDPAHNSLVLLVTIDGTVVVNGKVLTDPQLEEIFRKTYGLDRDTQVIINADKGVTHGRVVDLMEQAKSAGLKRIAIGTGG